MPVGNIPQTTILPINGIKISAVKAGIRYPGRTDLVLFEIVDGASVAAVFTQNIFCAAPVIIAKNHLQTTVPKYLLINTGNANAGTGDIGLAAANLTCNKLATIAGVSATEVLPFSTGVTTEFLPTEPIINHLPELLAKLKPDNWQAAATGIMTTDTVPKSVSVKFKINNEIITISGITKGSGMIKPDMATMLSFIATDAKIPQPQLAKMLTTASEQSFNRITVDGDTSTNDACVLIATGTGYQINVNKDYEIFSHQLNKLCQQLAQYMVRDAEGATKFITIKVSGGANSQDCLAVAYKIAHSPLVKTAFFASDANVGRIMVAIGNAKIANIKVENITMAIGGILILNNGIDIEYCEADLQPIMQNSEINIEVDLKMGNVIETVWTCDLSYDYVKINADYRT